MCCELDSSRDHGAIPIGHRLDSIAGSGSFDGPRLKGEVVDSSGGDRHLVRQGGAGALDAWLSLRTGERRDARSALLAVALAGLFEQDSSCSFVGREHVLDTQ